MKLMFYHGPGNLVTKLIRFLTAGPYSHVELQFSDGCRFFASGHGLFTGVNVDCKNTVYDLLWDTIFIPVTRRQEGSAERFAFTLVGLPFDWRGMWGFLIPFFDRKRKGTYCSAIILDLLQTNLHMFPGVSLKVSPSGLYRLFMAEHPMIISDPAPS